MRRKAIKVLVLVTGIVFIVLGLFGLVLPFLQGIIFLIIGFALVSWCSPRVRLWTNNRTKHHPRLSSAMNKIEAWINKTVGKI